MALKNLDNIVLNKQNFSNFCSKRKFHINIKGKIFVRFAISNPFPFDLKLTKMKLILDFTNDKNEKSQRKEEILEQKGDTLEKINALDFELENKEVNLFKFST